MSSPLDEDGVPATPLFLLATRLRRVSEPGASLPDICPISAATRACPPRVATPRAPPDEPVPSHLRSRPGARHRLGSRFCRIEAAPAPVPANASLARIPRADAAGGTRRRRRADAPVVGTRVASPGCRARAARATCVFCSLGFSLTERLRASRPPPAVSFHSHHEGPQGSARARDSRGRGRHA